MVAILFAREDSTYKLDKSLDVYDIKRDARTWPGGCPVVAHPPCRAWGRLRHFAKPRPDEKSLAIYALEQVRKFGGVLEHPVGSTLWVEENLPAAGAVDDFGGWTLTISQNWFGHRAQKNTWLYIVGVTPAQIPDFPMVLGEATHTVTTSGRRKDGSRSKARPKLAKAEREHTPPELAVWLVELASRCSAP